MLVWWKHQENGSTLTHLFLRNLKAYQVSYDVHEESLMVRSWVFHFSDVLWWVNVASQDPFGKEIQMQNAYNYKDRSCWPLTAFWRLVSYAVQSKGISDKQSSCTDG